MLLWIYLVALAASHLFQVVRPPAADRRDDRERAGEGPGRSALAVPPAGDDGLAPGWDGAAASHLSVLSFEPVGAEAGEPRAPVLLLHGSPGSARNFEDLGPALARTGRAVHALDLPGFGRSTRAAPSYSIRAHAHAALGALDAMGIERAHVVTWSMGGGVGLHMVDLAPERVASLTQIAAIGVQEAEGSGSYHFEHLKYALLWALLSGLPELVPDFGLLGPPGRGRTFVRNFWDTDQRPLRAIMERSRTPTLILQGRDDFLVPGWTAESSHELIGPSRLVVLDGTHFLPFAAPYGQLERCLPELVPFLERHDRPGRPEPHARVDRAPRREGLARVAAAPHALTRAVPWWLLLAGVAGLAAGLPRTAPLAAGLGVAGLQLDLGLALVACVLGGALRAAARRAAGWGARWRRALRGGAAALALGLAGVVAGSALAFPLDFAWAQAAALGALAFGATRHLVRGREPGAGGPSSRGRERPRESE